MKGAILAVAAALLVAGAAATGADCDPTYECRYTYTNLATQTQYLYDFSSLCASTDYTLQDTLGHNYYANICGQAKQNCLPESWTNTYEYGVAVQTWGSTPTCDPANPGPCQNPQTKAKQCCTADCQVLGTGSPQWFLTDTTNPISGGVTAKYKGAAASESDPFWCDFNPATGAQYEREVHFVFTCDKTVSTVRVDHAQQNATNDCRYKLFFNTIYACAGEADQGPSGGTIFIIVLLCLFVAYVVVGMLITYSQERIWTFPNKQFWGDFADLVKAGVAFTASGFKKDGAGG
eukprot:CAMPEP_0203816318 /NCGR_PEP_ID=MMETSP0115-20131106/14450_1 /ASSEMBLY_ACC=CAM_ASM_000227 /TAXON_ID=33651 /ORGANISM="Bicosoecid sp, Strain ms1" /LENGTH=290 /DNA_ID=CAMNT_0050725219 /DNA_START=33 /DNA_END=901 /DNA_ORIENTATION=+